MVLVLKPALGESLSGPKRGLVDIFLTLGTGERLPSVMSLEDFLCLETGLAGATDSCC